MPALRAPHRQDGVTHALVGTLPGRAVVLGLAIKLVVSLASVALGSVPPLLGVIDTVAGLAIAAGGVYFLVKLVVVAKRRLLWRVRRKLILSYIFIGVIPAVLIAAFFLLGGLLLFYNFSSYLVQSRLTSIVDRTRLVAESAALEIQRAGGRDVAAILERRRTSVSSDLPALSLAVVSVARSCAQPGGASPGPGAVRPAPAEMTAGPWAHADAPRTLPEWIGCQGFGDVVPYRRAGAGEAGGADDIRLLVRAVAFPDSPTPGYAVVVDAPVDEAVKTRIREQTGVEIMSVSAVSVDRDSDVASLPGQSGRGDRTTADQNMLVPKPAAPLNWVTFLQHRNWTNGRVATLVVSTQLNIRDIYDRIAAAQGVIGNRSFGQALLVVLLVVVGGLFLIIEFIALIVGLALAKSITGSVHELFTGTERVRQGDFTHKIAVKAADQLGELAESFNSMTASIEDLLREAAEKKRLEEELRIAREIQMSLLPQGPLTMPGLSVTALCVPAREVGGDYYDFLRLDDHRLGVLIADVSGKGTSAALYMAELKGLVLSLSQIHTSPRQLMMTANRIIANNLDAKSFITMTYAVIDLHAKTMTYARAGHTPLIQVPGPGSDSPQVRILAPDGLVLGLKIDNGETFDRLLEEATIQLRAGDLYLFFTDGITEAMNAGDDCFGETRLGRILAEHAHLPSDELRERVLREIEAFVGDAPQHDDMTMILLKVDEVAEPAATTRATFNAEVAGIAESR